MIGLTFTGIFKCYVSDYLSVDDQLNDHPPAPSNGFTVWTGLEIAYFYPAHIFILSYNGLR